MSESTGRWLPVVGHEGFYEVSDHGGVRSLDRLVARCKPTGPMLVRGRVLRPKTASKFGHLRVSLKVDGVERTFGVHALVLRAFVGPPPPGYEGCHNDGDPTNNWVGNLRWGARSTNVRDSVRHGTHHMTRRASCPRGHRLVRPNLRPVAASKGHRLCLACNRASAMLHKARRAGNPFDMQAESDARYVDIMGIANL